MLEIREYRQLVSRLISITGRDVNIMDINGIIVASSNPERINTFHEASRICAAGGRQIVITHKNKHIFNGCKEGINMPIYYNGNIICVVGITGETDDTDDMKAYALLVKELVELIISESQKQKYETFQRTTEKRLIRDLCKENNEEEKKILLQRVEMLGWDLKKLDLLMIMEITEENDIFQDMDEMNEMNKMNVQHNIQERNQKIIDYITSKSTGSKIANVSGNRFIILREHAKKEKLKNDLEKLVETIERKFEIKIYVALGLQCESIYDYEKAYIIARDTIKKAKLIKKEKIYFADEYLLEITLSKVRDKYKKLYLDQFVMFLNNKEEVYMKELLETIKAYFENNMNLSKTAEKLFLHRNTITYRFNKIKTEYGIDVTNSYECMQIYVCICLLGM